jgi:hypothetical protein
VVDDALVEILTTKMGVTSGGQDLENTLVDGEQGDIEGTTTEIVDDDLALTVGLVQAVGDGGGGGLVDDTEDVETGNDTGILGGLTLVVLGEGLASQCGKPLFVVLAETYVEVGGDRDNGVGDLLAEVGLGDLLHLSEDHGRHLLGGELLLGSGDLDLNDRLAILVNDLVGEVLDVGLDILLLELATDQTPKKPVSTFSLPKCYCSRDCLLDIVDGVVRVRRGLVLGGVTDKTLLLREGHI